MKSYANTGNTLDMTHEEARAIADRNARWEHEAHGFVYALKDIHAIAEMLLKNFEGNRFNKKQLREEVQSIYRISTVD